MREAIEASGLADVLTCEPASWPSSPDAYDLAHVQWCERIESYFKDADVQATRGRVAKIVAIYVKTLVVVGGHDDQPLAGVAHPPVDRMLLQALARVDAFPKASRALWRRTVWTKLDPDGYAEVISSLRAASDGGPLWALEEYWGAA